jgi:hydrogenase-4 membrane subunit HyfE
MLSSLVLAGLALRVGLVMRRRRQQGARREAALILRHLRWAKPAVILILIGFVGGPISSYLLRGWQPFERLHGYLALLVVGLFSITGVLGLRLERGRGRPVEAHAWLALIAMLAAAVTAVAGFVLLP